MRNGSLGILAILIMAVAAPSVAAAQGKKVYISVDLEGIAGVNGDDQTSPGGAEYGRARKLMAEDANAAIRGAFEGGATDVLVNDSHGGQRNLLPEDLDPRARLISHTFKRYGMMEGLDETFDAIIYVGYHAKADAPRGLFAHTGSGVVRDLQVNGTSVGEGGLNAVLAAWFGVPVVAVSGDDVAVEEVKALVPGIRGAVVKRAINMRAVELRPLVEARKDIQNAAREGVRSLDETGALATEPLSGADAVPELHDSGSGLGLQRNESRGTRHGGVHARDHARSLPAGPRAVPLHQPGLTLRQSRNRASRRIATTAGSTVASAQDTAPPPPG